MFKRNSFLNKRGFTEPSKCLFLLVVWVPNTLAFRLLLEQCAAWRVFFKTNRAPHCAICSWVSPKLSKILLDLWVLFQCFKWKIKVDNSLYDLNNSYQSTNACPWILNWWREAAIPQFLLSSSFYQDRTALCSLMDLGNCVCCSWVVLMSTCSEYYD